MVKTGQNSQNWAKVAKSTSWSGSAASFRAVVPRQHAAVVPLRLFCGRCGSWCKRRKARWRCRGSMEMLDAGKMAMGRVDEDDGERSRAWSLALTNLWKMGGSWRLQWSGRRSWAKAMMVLARDKL